MNLVSVKQSILFISAFLLASIGDAPQVNGKTQFKINNESVPAVVATVNGTDLTADLLKREMIAYQLMISQQGQTLESKDEGKIARGLVMKAIDMELVYQQGLRKNITIDSATVERELNNIQGQFPNKKLFLAALAAQRLTFDVLKKKIEQELIREEFVRVEIAPRANVSDEAASSFYEQNKVTFVRPESFKISHIYVSTPTSNEGKAGSVEDQAKAKKIIAWVKKEAKKKVDQASIHLKSGRTFSSVAKEFSEDSKTADKGGSIGVVMKGQGGLLPEVADALIKMQVGEISDVIESNLGFHIVQLNDKKDSQAIPLEEVKSEILNHLLKLETEKLLKSYLSKLRKKSDIKIFF